ncbi:MAG: response regulator transcription factor [Lachnospiraceae bacterium]|nr:response regulator transcription factor [Lachnospiraceae bacterium]
MRIAICDDEPLYRQILREKIAEDSFVHNYDADISEYSDGRQLIEAVENGAAADVFFLDIQTRQGTDDGIRTGRKLRERGENGLIVYVTGFIDYVQTGYEVRAFRYLLKNQIPEKLPGVLADIRRELSDTEYTFQAGGETLRVDRRRILYLESNIRTLRLVTLENEYRFYDTLDHAEVQLGEPFLRCHRSFLVNKRMIRKYSGSQIILPGEIAIPISRSYARQVKQRLMLEMR